MVLLGIGHSHILMCGLYKLLSELGLEVSGSSIDRDVLEVLVEFQLVKFLLLESLEGLLD